MYRVLHVDLDQFIAAVEMLRRPELAGRPVVVGGKGDPTQRGVVATASYAAREFGVRSGMPLRTALKRCPDAVFLPSDKPAYEEASEQVMDVLRGLDAVVEVTGWDEAFLGVEADDPVAFAQDVRRAVLEATDLHSCVGIGDNLLRAKIATEFAKPPDGAGVFTLTERNWDAVMAHRPARALWGIGPKTARKLADRGIDTVADLAATDPATLAADLGPSMGPYFVQLGRGIGRASVEGTPWVRRSLSHETTFPADLTDWDDIRAEVVTLARQVAADLQKEAREVARVAVKVRFAPFTTRTRSATLDAPTMDAAELEAAALRVFGLFTPGRAVRLLGVRAEFGS